MKIHNKLSIITHETGDTMDKVLDVLNSQSIDKTDYIVVGCSGGPDSMCLLDILHKNEYKVVCAHVNHNIRKESDDEYKFLKDFCEKNSIIFEGLELEKGLNENESYYRKERYKFYKRTADKYNSKIIMTAHHGDDLIETVWMRITRGSNIKGYMGFPKSYMEGKYRIVKPLITLSKEDILKYDEENSIPYVLDSTNELDDYTRNRYRHNILDFLKKEDPNIHLKYLKYSEELESVSNFVDSVVEKSMNDNFAGGQLSISKFCKLDSLIQKKELEKILKSIYGDDIDKIGFTHTQDILNLIYKGKNFKYDLPLGVKIEREYDLLSFKKDEEENTYFYELSSKVILPDDSTIEIVKKTNDNSNNVIRLSSDMIKLPLYVRTRKDGDKIEVKNLEGSKKVKSIFIDEKIKPSLRDTIPLVVDASDRVLWIPGVKKSKFDIKKDEKCDIILKYTKKEGTRIEKEK